jgi:tryptophan synthase alpha chain
LTKARVEDRFAALRQAAKAAFIPYVMAGDPTLEASLAILRGLPDAGADLIELGFPFSDPTAEGVPIQRAAERALKGGMTVSKTFDLVRAFRQDDQNTPLILMGYFNNVLAFGLDRFASAAAQSGVDGLIVVDCPPEEAEGLADALDRQDLALIRLTTPTTDAARLALIARRTSGFVYHVSIAGVTGTKEADEDAVAPVVARVRAATGLPVAVGFGVKTPARAAAIARIADAAVVGSALVDEGAAACLAGEAAAPRVLNLARALAAAVHGARAPIAI